MDNERREQWEQAAHARFDAFLQRVKEELPADASIADIERVLLKHENSLMSDTFALLVEHPEVFPPADKSQA
jgi:hypothetical protein